MPHYKLLNLRFLLLRTIHAWRTYICIYLGMRRSGAPRNILKACWNRRAWVRIWIDWLLDSSTSFRNSYAEYARNFPQVFRWIKPSYEDCDAVEQILLCMWRWQSHWAIVGATSQALTLRGGLCPSEACNKDQSQNKVKSTWWTVP